MSGCESGKRVMGGKFRWRARKQLERRTGKENEAGVLFRNILVRGFRNIPAGGRPDFPDCLLLEVVANDRSSPNGAPRGRLSAKSRRND